jgi:hypothetical protein
MVSSAVLAANNQPGLQLIPNTYTSFGNSYYLNGVLSSTMQYSGNVTDSTNTGPLTDLGATRSSVLTALTNVSDHLPVVADYTIAGLTALPEPATMALPLASFAMFLTRRRNGRGKSANCAA